jgi:predicted transcriptional regulator of viral defense system
MYGGMMPSKSHESQGFRLLRELFTHGKQIFNMDDTKIAANAQNISSSKLSKILSNLTKQGRILRLRRGLYVSLGLGEEYTSIHAFVISSYLIQPSVISHWSALQHHGLTEQIPQIITASTTKKILTPSMREKQESKLKAKHAWDIAGVRYEYTHVQKKHDFGIEKIWLDEHFNVSITDKERTLLDVFIYPKMFGGIGEALGLLENSLPIIDIQKLVDYAIQYDKKSIAKRLGWALEYFGVPAKKLQPLLKVPIHYFCRLDASSPAKGPCDTHWMIQNNLIKADNK